jgi:DNA-binding GntR family transcriptional regulator
MTFQPTARSATRAGAPLERQTVTTMTLSALRDRILRGIYLEGEPLRQDALAEELGVSRIPIREALRQLEAEGLVTLTPHRGAIVSTLSLSEVEEIFGLRADIEGDLLRRSVPRLAAPALTRAEQILTDFEAALAAGDASVWGELNWGFHSCLYGAAERPVTLGIASRLHQQCERYLRMHLSLAHGGERANEQHRGILRLAQARDADGATRLLREHILGAGESLLRYLEERRNMPAPRPA